jgi:hypothetical protein
MNFCLFKEQTLNKKMKKNYSTPKMLLTIIFSLFTLIPNGVSQNENLNKKKSSIKPFYLVEANFGISTCNKREYNSSIHTFEARLAYQTLVYGANFAGGIELAHYFKAGLGLSYFYYKQKDTRYPYPSSPVYIPNSMTTHGIPLFLYLRSDFLDRKISPYMDIKIGNNFLITKETIDFNPSGFFEREFSIEDFGNFKLKNGLFFASNIGIAFKTNCKTTINLSTGYRCISRNYDMPYNVGPFFPDTYSGIPDPKYVKTGYITIDHQFVLSMGVSF